MRRIGVSSNGEFNPDGSKWGNFSEVTNLYDVRLFRQLQDKLGKDWQVNAKDTENDGQLQGYLVARQYVRRHQFHNGKIIYLVAGTGLGGGAYDVNNDGVVHPMPYLVPHTIPANGGGSADQYLSGRAAFRRATQDHYGKALEGHEVDRLAHKGDAYAKGIFEQIGEALAHIILSINEGKISAEYSDAQTAGAEVFILAGWLGEGSAREISLPLARKLVKEKRPQIQISLVSDLEDFVGIEKDIGVFAGAALVLDAKKTSPAHDTSELTMWNKLWGSVALPPRLGSLSSAERLRLNRLMRRYEPRLEDAWVGFGLLRDDDARLARYDEVTNTVYIKHGLVRVLTHGIHPQTRVLLSAIMKKMSMRAIARYDRVRNGLDANPSSEGLVSEEKAGTEAAIEVLDHLTATLTLEQRSVLQNALNGVTNELLGSVIARLASDTLTAPQRFLLEQQGEIQLDYIPHKKIQLAPESAVFVSFGGVDQGSRVLSLNNSTPENRKVILRLRKEELDGREVHNYKLPYFLIPANSSGYIYLNDIVNFNFRDKVVIVQVLDGAELGSEIYLYGDEVTPAQQRSWEEQHKKQITVAKPNVRPARIVSYTDKNISIKPSKGNRNRLSLDGRWELSLADDGEAGTDWVQAEVPGEIHDALFSAGKIQDVLVGFNRRSVTWIDAKDAVYRKNFDIDDSMFAKGARVYLKLDGVNTLSTVSINGIEIGRFDNMFIPVRIDVTENLRVGTNQIEVRLSSLREEEKAREQALQVDLSDVASKDKTTFHTSIRTQASASGFSSAAPQVDPLLIRGIWRSVYLEAEGPIVLDDTSIQVATERIDVAAGTAALKINLHIKNNTIQTEQRMLLTTKVSVHGAQVITKDEVIDVSPQGKMVGLVLQIDQAKFWWPHTMGQPNLYNYKIEIRSKDGSLVDSIQGRFGIREIKLIQKYRPDHLGETFYLEVNGRPLFTKGANYVPAEVLTGRNQPAVTRRKVQLLELMKAGNMDMIRIWGGGLWEEAALYEAADELGIMIWQDFLLACAYYCKVDSFMNQLETEARTQLMAVRNHPSLAIVAGGNEVIRDRYYPLAGLVQTWDAILYKMFPRLVQELAPGMIYYPSTSVGGNRGVNDPSEGDIHQYPGVYDVEHSFTSVIPSARTEFNLTRSWPNNPTFLSHQARQALQDNYPKAMNDNGIKEELAYYGHYNQLEETMAALTGKPKTLEEAILFSQIAQGIGLTQAIEHDRRNWPNTGMDLFWAINAGFSSVGHEVINLDGTPKAGYFFVKRAYQENLISFKYVEEQELSVSVSNGQRTAEQKARLIVKKVDYSGIEQELVNREVTLTPNSAYQLEALDLRNLERAAGQGYLAAEIWMGETRLAENFHFWGPAKDVLLHEHQEFRVEAERLEKNRVRLKIFAKDFLPYIEIKVNQGADYSDNYFHVPGGESREVLITLRESVEGADARPLSVEVTPWRGATVIKSIQY